MPEGATLNRKLTVDYLSKQDPPDEMAIYLMPLDQLHRGIGSLQEDPPA